MSLQPLVIGNLVARYPIIQGGMGVGISRSNLAGAVAREGGIGIISTAQIGYDEEDFYEHPIETNLKAIKKHVKKAKEIAAGGIVGVNIMVATRNYEQYVKASVDANVDVIISGAGLPLSLPEYVRGSQVKIAPIVSSAKSASVILKMWHKKSHRTADFIVIEGPKAGGHLGFSVADAKSLSQEAFELEIHEIIKVVREFEQLYQQPIPVILAGGIYNYEDILHAISLGANGVQIASRFVATYECDASDAYKQRYLQATKDEIEIVVSPVGLPGRAIHNEFLENLHAVTKKQPVEGKCLMCLAKCNPATIPYCISRALIAAVTGDLTHALLFCGDNTYRIHSMTSVKELMEELTGRKDININS